MTNTHNNLNFCGYNLFSTFAIHLVELIFLLFYCKFRSILNGLNSQEWMHFTFDSIAQSHSGSGIKIKIKKQKFNLFNTSNIIQDHSSSSIPNTYIFCHLE